MTRDAIQADLASIIERGRRREIDGDEVGAIADFAEALALATKRADRSTELVARTGLLRIARDSGRALDATVQREAIDALLAPGELAPLARAEALTEVGLLSVEAGEDARATLEAAFAVAAGEPVSDESVRVQVQALIHLAYAQRLRGDYQASRASLDRALALSEDRFGPGGYEVADVLEPSASSASSRVTSTAPRGRTRARR